MKLTTSDKYSHEDLLLCPQCGQEYLHISRVVVATGHTETKIDSSGTTVRQGGMEVARAVAGRGNRIILEYWCELGGHHGTIELQFHKGYLYVEGREFADFQELLDPIDIWRD